jgi:hypothetical protein
MVCASLKARCSIGVPTAQAALDVRAFSFLSMQPECSGRVIGECSACLALSPTVRRLPKADHDPDDARVPRLWRRFLWKADAVDPHQTSLERAFQLARSGRCATIDDIKQRLKAELYDQHIIEGRSLRSQLRALIAASREKTAP